MYSESQYGVSHWKSKSASWTDVGDIPSPSPLLVAGQQFEYSSRAVDSIFSQPMQSPFISTESSHFLHEMYSIPDPHHSAPDGRVAFFLTDTDIECEINGVRATLDANGMALRSNKRQQNALKSSQPKPAESAMNTFTSMSRRNWRDQAVDTSTYFTPPETLTPASPATPESLAAIDESRSPVPVDMDLSRTGRNGNLSKNRTYSAEEWDNIKPEFVRLYPKMTLARVAQKLREQYDFHATLPMYKKRITAWGLKKYTNRQGKPPNLEDGMTRGICSACDKPVDKTTSGEAYNAGHLITSPKESKEESFSTSTCLETDQASAKLPILIRCRSPAETLDNIDRLFLALQSLTMATAARTYGSTRAQEERLAFIVDDALVSWKLNAYKKANRAWRRATQLIRRWLKCSTIPGHTVLYYLLREAWPRCLPVFLSFMNLISTLARQMLSKSHPLVIVATLLESLPSCIQRGSVIWDCVVDHMSLDSCTEEWADAALYRIRYCRRNSRPDLATLYCQKALAKLEEFALPYVSLRLDLTLELAEALYQECEYEKSIHSFEEVVTIASREPTLDTLYTLRALERLGEIHEEDTADFLKARRYYLKAFETSLETRGIDDSESMYLLRELLLFYQRHDEDIQQVLPPERFLDTYCHLNEITVGLWKFSLDRDGNIVQQTRCDLDQYAEAVDPWSAFRARASASQCAPNTLDPNGAISGLDSSCTDLEWPDMTSLNEKIS